MIILVVEDEIKLRNILKDHFEGLGHFVITAKDGKLALDRILNTDGLDLVISDNQMPIMTGRELLTHLSLNNVSHPPFILWTGGDIKTLEKDPIVRDSALAILEKPELKDLEEYIEAIAIYNSDL